MSALNRTHLATRGYVVYLCAPVELLVERTARDRNRPLLFVDDPAARMREILRERDALYRAVADLVVKTDRRSARHVVKHIEREITSNADFASSDANRSA